MSTPSERTLEWRTLSKKKDVQPFIDWFLVSKENKNGEFFNHKTDDLDNPAKLFSFLGRISKPPRDTC